MLGLRSSGLLVFGLLLGLACVAFDALGGVGGARGVEAALLVQPGAITGVVLAGTVGGAGFFESLRHDIAGFFAGLPQEIRLGLIGLGHIAPALTAVATTTEALSGNAELIPLTQVAGASAADLAASLDHTSGTAGLLSALAGHVATVAANQGATSVANAASTIESAALAVADSAVRQSVALPVSASAGDSVTGGVADTTAPVYLGGGGATAGTQGALLA